MAKRKRTTRKSKSKAAPQHSLPVGFWSQVGAVLLIAISLLLVIAWFGAGGPILEWMHSAALAVIGYAVFMTPLLFVYIAVETFRAEDNKLPFVMKLATTLMIIWFAGLFGLMKDDAGQALGGFMGRTVNGGMLALVDPGVAMFLYVLFIAITALFVLRMSPMTVIRSLGQ